MTTTTTAKAGGPAFPVTTKAEGVVLDHGATRINHTGFAGMSLRDYFAGQLLPAVYQRALLNPEHSAAAAYRFADAMLAVRQLGEASPPVVGEDMSEELTAFGIGTSVADGDLPEIPDVVGDRMHMNHEDFQQTCNTERARLQLHGQIDSVLTHLLCEAVRCSRQCADLEAASLFRVQAPTEGEKGGDE